MIIRSGNILNAGAEYVMHQTNCVTIGSAGVAKVLFDKYPIADIYKSRNSPSSPGTTSVHKTPTGMSIVNLMGQYLPGYASNTKGLVADTKASRIAFFSSALMEFLVWLKANETNLYSFTVAAPYRIGCGMAGGDWLTYEETLLDFEEKLQMNHEATLVLYKYP
jgi:hypothetical protein